MTSRKRVARRLTLRSRAGDAAMADIGKMLGPAGVNTRQVKPGYDAPTAGQRGDVVPVEVTVFEDRTYELRYKTPPTAYPIREVLGLESGAARPGGQVVAKLSREQPHDVAARKLPDLNTADLRAAMRQVAGTARAMGVMVDW